MLRAAQASVRPGLPVQALPAASRRSKAVRWAWLAAPVSPSQSREETQALLALLVWPSQSRAEMPGQTSLAPRASQQSEAETPVVPPPRPSVPHSVAQPRLSL